MQMVITTWRNSGDVPIRAIDAFFTFRDSKRREIGRYEYTLFAVFDDEAGVAPGEVYTTPAGEGFVFPNPDVTAASVDVEVLRVSERSGI